MTVATVSPTAVMSLSGTVMMARVAPWMWPSQGRCQRQMWEQQLLRQAFLCQRLSTGMCREQQLLVSSRVWSCYHLQWKLLAESTVAEAAEVSQVSCGSPPRLWWKNFLEAALTAPLLDLYARKCRPHHWQKTWRLCRSYCWWSRIDNNISLYHLNCNEHSEPLILQLQTWMWIWSF